MESIAAPRVIVEPMSSARWRPAGTWGRSGAPWALLLSGIVASCADGSKDDVGADGGDLGGSTAGDSTGNVGDTGDGSGGAGPGSSSDGSGGLPGAAAGNGTGGAMGEDAGSGGTSDDATNGSTGAAGAAGEGNTAGVDNSGGASGGSTGSGGSSGTGTGGTSSGGSGGSAGSGGALGGAGTGGTSGGGSGGTSNGGTDGSGGDSGDPPVLHILNFHKSVGIVHPSLPDGIAGIESLATDAGWTFVSTNDSSIFNDSDLAEFDVLVWTNTCGVGNPVLAPSEQQAFVDYIEAGGGFVGIHCALGVRGEGGSFQDWYEGLVAVRTDGHPAVQTASLNVDEPGHVSAIDVPNPWSVRDEWYNWTYNPRTHGVNVVLTVDEDSYTGENTNLAGDHPYSWYHEYDGGRAWVTGLGHTSEIYVNPVFVAHVRGGILWAAGVE